jgi:anaerobic selenocysteine-containing dehydrogenase
MGTNNVDHCARLCHAPTLAALAASFGSGAMTNSIGEIGNASCILTIGTNTAENHPIIFLQIKKAVRNGAKLIVADPREIGLCRLAHIWLRHNPGTDVPLLMGMARVILDEGLLNRDFIERQCEAHKPSLAIQSRGDSTKVWLCEEFCPFHLIRIAERDLEKIAWVTNVSGRLTDVQRADGKQMLTVTPRVLGFVQALRRRSRPQPRR